MSPAADMRPAVPDPREELLPVEGGTTTETIKTPEVNIDSHQGERLKKLLRIFSL